MDKAARKPSLAERAAYLRRAQSRARTVAVNRTPNAPLSPSMVNARDALEVAWDATMDLRPEEPAHVSPATVPNKPSQGKGATSDATVYKTHMRSRLMAGGRKWYVRTDAWARARSTRVGRARLARHIIRPVVVPENPAGVPSNGVVPQTWDDLHNPRAVALRNERRFTQTRHKSPWVLVTRRPEGIEYEVHAETGEPRNVRRI